LVPRGGFVGTEARASVEELSDTAAEPAGLVFNIMRFSLHDGPGLRTSIFLKGCPLDCWWCHNPESQQFQPSLMYFAERCRRCGDCVAVCPHGAIALVDGTVATSAACRRCGACVEACLAEARQLFGRRMTVSRVIQEAERDLVFFDESGGGVTVSGGEPLSQPEFAEALLAACRQRRIHTVLDTSGFAPRETFLRVSRHAHLVLYDLKFIDAGKHRAYTGVTNEQILSNLEALRELGRPVVIRFPVIPGINDGEEDIAQLAAFLSRLGLRRIDLLPYVGLGVDKYRRLGLTCRVAALRPPADARLGRIREELTEKGFAVNIGG